MSLFCGYDLQHIRVGFCYRRWVFRRLSSQVILFTMEYTVITLEGGAIIMSTLPTPAQFQQMLVALADTSHPQYEQCERAVRAVVEQLGLTDLYQTDPLQPGFQVALLLRQHHQRQN